MSNISQWNTSDASNNSASPNGAPEGMAPSGVNDSMRGMYGAIARWFEDMQGGLVTAGTSNAYTLTTNNNNAALADQSLLVFRADRANTGTATLNVDTLGAKTIEVDGVALSSGHIVADSIYIVAYNSTNDTYDILNGIGEIPDSNLSANVPLLDASNVFSNVQEIQGASPRLRLGETGVTADNGNWAFLADAETLNCRVYDDAWSASSTFIQVLRTGTTVDEVEINGTLVDVNGSLDVSGSLVLGTDLAVTHGGTGASTDTAARTNLGVAIGSDVQAWDTNLDQIAALAVTNSNFMVGNGSAWVAESGTTVRTSLGLTIGSDVQAHDVVLDDLAGLTAVSGANQFIVSSGAGAYAHETASQARTSLALGSLATLSAVDNDNWDTTDLAIVNGGTGASTDSGARTNLGVAIGSDVQAHDVVLDDIAALTAVSGADQFIVSTAAGTYAHESATTARGSLGLGSLATLSAIDNDNWDTTDLAVANGGTGASDAATARSNLSAAADTLSGVDFTGLTALEGNALASTDDFLVMDGTTAKRIEYTDSGCPVETVTGTTDTLATANMNTFIEYDNASPVAVTLNTGVGKVGNWLIIKQTGAGQVTVSGTATTEAAVGTKTRTQHSVITLLCIAANTWAVYGDQAA